MKTIHGDITTAKQGIIVQQVNAQGVMNSGVAKAVRDKWPNVWETYSGLVQPHQSDYGESSMGKVITAKVEDDLFVLNIVGQQFFGRDGKRYTSYDALDTGFKYIAEYTTLRTPIHIPLLGAGLGGGKWPVIRAIIMSHLNEHDLTLWLQPGTQEPLN